LVEEREKHPTEAEFWAKFTNTDSGLRLGFQEILDTLKKERSERDVHDAANAHQFFNGDLGHADANGTFTYTSKAGNSIVMRKAGDIARNWRNLLASNPSVAAQWGNQQTE
jgi:hypothetical protein